MGEVFCTGNQEMESSLKKCFCLLGFFLVILSISEFSYVEGAGPCGNNSPDAEAINMVPCITAAEDARASVSSSCCSQVKKIGQNPSCLCAILLSDTAKMAGIRPDIAITIPKRCNFADRPVGYKCGPYTLPRWKRLKIKEIPLAGSICVLACYYKNNISCRISTKLIVAQL